MAEDEDEEKRSIAREEKKKRIKTGTSLREKKNWYKSIYIFSFGHFFPATCTLAVSMPPLDPKTAARGTPTFGFPRPRAVFPPR